MEIAAKLAREQVSRKKGIPQDQIGIFMITQRTAKATAIKRPIGLQKSNIDGTISLVDLYSDILNAIPAAEDDPTLATASGRAIGWARSGGETVTINAPDYLVADGLTNLISILEQTEMGHFRDIDYIECMVCQGGCVGGPLTVENSSIARIMTRKLAGQLPQKCPPENTARSKEMFRLVPAVLQIAVHMRKMLPGDMLK